MGCLKITYRNEFEHLKVSYSNSLSLKNSAEKGYGLYELKNHLGNVLAVVTDRKIVKPYVNSVFDGFESDLVSYSSYYPFGMEIPALSSNSSEYRYSFQGQEKDDEIKGKGNSINYKYRMHDPRLGRFFAVDPLSWKYPWYSPYQFSGNEVIATIELEGLEPKRSYSELNKMVENGEITRWAKVNNPIDDGSHFICSDCKLLGGWNGGAKVYRPTLKKVTANDIAGQETTEDDNAGDDDKYEFISESYEFFERRNNSGVLKDINVPKEADALSIRFETGTEADYLIVKDADGNELLNTGPVLNGSNNPTLYEIKLDDSVNRSGITFETSSKEPMSLGVVEVDFYKKVEK